MWETFFSLHLCFLEQYVFYFIFFETPFFLFSFFLGGGREWYVNLENGVLECMGAKIFFLSFLVPFSFSSLLGLSVKSCLCPLALLIFAMAVFEIPTACIYPSGCQRRYTGVRVSAAHYGRLIVDWGGVGIARGCEQRRTSNIITIINRPPPVRRQKSSLSYAKSSLHEIFGHEAEGSP